MSDLPGPEPDVASARISANTFSGQTAVLGSGVQHNTFRSTDPRLLAGVPAVVLGVGVAVLSYPAVAAVWPAPGAATAAVGAGLVIGVAVWLGLSLILTHRRLTARRQERDQVLESLAAPAALTADEQSARQAAAREDPLGMLLSPQRALLGLQAGRTQGHAHRVAPAGNCRRRLGEAAVGSCTRQLHPPSMTTDGQCDRVGERVTERREWLRLWPTVERPGLASVTVLPGRRAVGVGRGLTLLLMPAGR